MPIPLSTLLEGEPETPQKGTIPLSRLLEEDKTGVFGRIGRALTRGAPALESPEHAFETASRFAPEYSPDVAQPPTPQPGGLMGPPAPPVPPSQAEVQATPQGQLVGEIAGEAPLRAIAGQPELGLMLAEQAARRPPEIRAERRAVPIGEEEDSLLRQALGGLNLIDVEAARQRQRQQEAARAAVQLEGGRVPGPRIPGQFLARYADAFTLGVPRAFSEAIGFPVEGPPETVAEEVTAGAGMLAGFLTGAPLAVGRAVADRTLKSLAPVATDAVRTVFAKQVAREMAVLATASAAESTGAALEANTFAEAGRMIGESARGGALLGAAFGAAAGAIPENTLRQMATRVGAGLAAVDLATGRQPLDERALAQKVFDYGLNVFFLFRGRDPKATLARLQAAAARERLSPDAFFGRLSEEATRTGRPVTDLLDEADKAYEAARVPPRAEARPPAEPAPVPEAEAPPGAAPATVEATLRRAEEASRRAEAAVARVEELVNRPVRPEPLPVPPEEAAIPPEAPRVPPEGTERAPTVTAPAPPVAESRPTGAEIPPLERIPPTEPLPARATVPERPAAPGTFREFVLAQGKRWPIFVTDPDFVRLRDAYEDLVRPRYQQRGAEVVDRTTGEVVARAANGAAAQLEANRLNARRGEVVPKPAVLPSAPEVKIEAPPPTEEVLPAPGKRAEAALGIEPAVLRPEGQRRDRINPEAIRQVVSGMEIETPEGRRAAAGMDPRLMKVLGGNLYSGDLGRIAVKEMLQNAVDSLRELPDPSQGRVLVNLFDPRGERKAPTIFVSDTGAGMLPEVAAKEFVDIGGSRKAAEGASGGFGIAKVAIFANADEILVTTRARAAQGRIVETTLTGSGDEWLDPKRGLRLQSREIPAGDPAAGTSLTIRLKPDARYDGYSAKQFLATFLDQHRLPFAFEFNENGRPVQPSGQVPRDLDKLSTVQTPGAAIDIYASKEARSRSWAAVYVLNNGLPQFTQEFALPGEAKIPSWIVADIRAAAGPEAPDYPFRPDRQGLRDTANAALEGYIRDSIYREAAEKDLDVYRRALEAGVPFAADPVATGRVFDTTGRLPEDLVKDIAAAPSLPPLSRELHRAVEHLKDTLVAFGPEYDQVEYRGIGLGDRYLGVNISGEMATGAKGAQNILLVNPYLVAKEVAGHVTQGRIASEDASRQLAEQFVATLLHEVTHQAARPHGEDFAGALTRNTGRTLAIQQLAVNRLERILREDSDAAYQDLLGKLSRLENSYTSGEDIFGKISAGLASRARPPRREGVAPRGEEGRPRLAAPVPVGGERPPSGVGAGPERGGGEPRLLDAFGRPVEPVAPARTERIEGEAPPPPPGGGPVREAPVEPPPPLEEPILKLGRHKEVVEAAERMFTEAGVARDAGRWPILSDQILDMLREGTLDLPTMQRVLAARTLSLAEFGEQMFRPAVKNAAQRLQMLSALQRRLNQMARVADTKEQAQVLVGLAERAGVLGRETDETLKAMAWWRRADNVRRGLLVTQLATAVRNLETQLGRLGIDVLDRALQRTFGGQADPGVPLRALAETMSQLRPTKVGGAARQLAQNKIATLLEAFPRDWDRLFGSYSSDIAKQARESQTSLTGADRVFVPAERFVNLLNFFNRFQEFATRRPVFWAELSARLGKRGIDAEALARGERRLTQEEWDAAEPDVKAAVQKALEITFAQTPVRGSVGWHFVKLVNQLPLILTGPIPFPRFMAMSLRFLYEFSPLPLLTGRAFTEAERGKWRAGDRQTISRATLGTAMLLSSWLVREGQPDDNRWYEVTAPGVGTVDIRPFNPFAAYFFVGEVAKRARKGTLYKIESGDIIRGIASANVRGGLGLFALDKAVAGLGELAKTGKLADALKSAGGELLSGLLVPLRTLTDLYAEFDPEARISRERRGEPLLGPVKAQLPPAALRAVGVEVPEPVYAPTRAKPLTREQPALRQATGLIVTTEKNALERELDRLQFQRNEILPSTGNPEADNLIAKHMGPLAEERLIPFVETERYRRMTDAEKMDALAKRLRPVRAIARARARREDRDLFHEVKEERRPGRKRLLLEERATRRQEAIVEQGLRETEEREVPVPAGEERE